MNSLKLSNDIFWVGYLCCDPKPRTEHRNNRYDLFVDELNGMNFSGLKVLFNHNKHRKPLGEVKLTWHNHNIKGGAFAVGFLAVINNRILKNTPACMILAEDTFASLSTLESDRTCAIELSITYCGARDGCTGVVVSKDRVSDVVDQYGFPSQHYYKCQTDREISASIQLAMEDSHKDISPEEVLKQLPEAHYTVLKGYLEDQREALTGVVSQMELSEQKYQDLNEVQGLFSDYLSSLIQTRLMLEQNNDSELAMKRKAGFEDLKNIGLLDRNCSNLEASKKLIEYCRECFNDSPDSVYLDRFLKMFSERFPDLADQLPGDKSTATIDAAFNLISKKMRDKDISKLVREHEAVSKRAMNVAKTAFQKIEEQANPAQKKSPTNKADSSSNDKRAMSFKTFITQLGLNDSESDGESSPPPAKRPKRANNVGDQKPDESQDFLDYATKKEKDFQELQKRYKSYNRDYHQHKRTQQQQMNKRFEDLMTCIPTLTKMAETFDEKLATTPTKAERSSVEKRQKDDNQCDMQIDKPIPEGKSIDASAVQTEERLWKL